MKKIKIINLILLLLLTLSLFSACSTESETENSSSEEYVIKTRTGECYHYEGCWTIKNSIGTETITKTEAIEDYGLRDCSQCSPD